MSAARLLLVAIFAVATLAIGSLAALADEPAPATPEATPAPAATVPTAPSAPPAPPATPAPAAPAAAPAAQPSPAPASADDNEFFERQVRPVLAQHCLECHGQKKQEAGLRLDSRASLVKGSDNGPVLVPGNPAASKLVAAVRYNDENLQMPPDGKLPPEAIEALDQWVQRGLPWPEGSLIAPAADPDAWRKHWAFQPVSDPAEPAVQHAVWAKSPIDRFILAKLEAAGFEPSPLADRRTWLRRVTYDLVGLPPTAAEFEQFESDAAPDALERVVERLLASPAYGERWGRHWLDCARYADSKGYLAGGLDRNYANAFKYRDWVVRSINDDLPYDVFLERQIAADRLSSAEDRSTLAALGFLAVGRRFNNNKNDIIDDRLDTLCRTTMGLTISCARCHDHKFDPIAIKDYYSLYGVLASTNESGDDADIMVLADSDSPHNERVFVRGNAHNPGDEAPRQFLPCVAGDRLKPFTDGSGRLELAKAIADRANPLTARVMVNRVWLQYFGAGLVRTPSDFGLRSDPPTHPELLDWLARRFMDDGWSLKKLHRRIVLSAVYRQSSHETEEMRRRDPDNLLLGRMNRRRLDFEALRDSLLAVAGTLDAIVGGKPADLMSQPFSERRTLYGLVERQNLPGLFRTFDFASPDIHNPQRFITTVPQQALFLLNSPFVIQQAQALAARPEVQSQADPRQRAVALYRLALGRGPSESELPAVLEFVATAPAATSPTVWHYSYGNWDEAGHNLSSFDTFPHWTGNIWQGAAEHPDPKLNYLELRADGGHPGPKNLATVLRLNVFQAGRASIEGVFQHPRPEQDGVEAHVVFSRRGEIGSWVAHNGQVEIRTEPIEVQPGDVIDFVVTCRENNAFDHYLWSPVVRLQPAGDPNQAPLVFSAAAEFHGPVPPPLDVWQRLAHTLLLTNEFDYLD